MRIVASFPREVLVRENVFIPMSDGSRLAARTWLLADADRAPVPAILEYLPYRKADRMRERDEPMLRVFMPESQGASPGSRRGAPRARPLRLRLFIDFC